jgi:phospholipid-binding lipoprotein MlaA
MCGLSCVMAMAFVEACELCEIVPKRTLSTKGRRHWSAGSENGQCFYDPVVDCNAEKNLHEAATSSTLYRKVKNKMVPNMKQPVEVAATAGSPAIPTWRSSSLPTVCVLIAIGLSACVTLPANSRRAPQDPWESWNRGVYKFNDRLDRAVAKPVARAYVRVVPQPMRTGVTNFFSNLETPTVLVNDALQGKLLAAANDLGRFALNTTVGIGGILDPATSAGLARNNEDFGQTLGKWGVHAGPFVELPILGPSDLRDAPARFVDSYTNPRQYIKNSWVKYGLYLPDLTDRRAALLPLDDTLKSVYDPYAFVRDAYLERRAYLVSDGKVTDEPLSDPDADLPDPSTKRDPAGTASPSPRPDDTPAPK